ncbi:hypothetical protein [Halocatena salina]|uniref:Uncharacterized protein n=1 Tax=Halocatena salina TaxID=2934340 RepID=A0A8U0A9K1_9EURY|nr:hypothetical protein [Halocatena salina]UPM44527.1 hypothetical protein MW046_13940 [Halocatena salina]
MWGYIAIDRWLCDSVAVADLPETSGVPDFECGQIDVDATRLHESKEEYRIKRRLEDLFDDRSYIGILTQKPGFDKQASTGNQWSENERQVEELLQKIEDIDPEDPSSIETDVLKIDFTEKSDGSFGFISRWERIAQIIPDREEKIPRILKSKTNQVREGRPFVVFIDCKLKSIDSIKEVVWILIGSPHGFAFESNIEVSDEVCAARSEWGDYLEEIGAIPARSDSYTAIRPGEEGLFVADELSGIAGVLIRLQTNDVGYVPNIYTSEIDSRRVYDRIDWGLNYVSLALSDL